MKAEGGSGGGGSSEGGGGGGGFKLPDNDQLVRIGLAAAGATVLTYAITGGEGGGGGRSAHQISMQHFLGNVLASGRVRKLVVVNSSVVRVYVSEDPLGREGFGDPGASGGGESGPKVISGVWHRAWGFERFRGGESVRREVAET